MVSVGRGAWRVDHTIKIKHTMVRGAGEAIFAVARSAGWIAHGLEEYQHRLRYRIRAAYTGPSPG